MNNLDTSLIYDPDPNPDGECPVLFQDHNLQTAIEESLDIVYPTATDMLDLITLSASSRDIVDLTGLEQATNLTELYLQSNQISDISAVSGLTNLQYLYLYNNQISDISAVSELTNLLK